MAKFYAIRVGRKPGIYTTWPEAQKQVIKFAGAQYKSFPTKAEAEAYINGGNQMKQSDGHPKDVLLAYVDGSFNKVMRQYGSGIVFLKNEAVLAKLSIPGNDPLYVDSYQIAGEVIATVEAVKWAKEQGETRVVIYYDYQGIESWATGDWKASKPVSQNYKKAFDEVAQGMQVDFVKVKSHTGVEFNEMADELAKHAAYQRLN